MGIGVSCVSGICEVACSMLLCRSIIIRLVELVNACRCGVWSFVPFTISAEAVDTSSWPPAVGGNSHQPWVMSPAGAPAVGSLARRSKTPAVGGDARAGSHTKRTKSKTRSSHSARTRSKTPAIGRDDAREAAAAAALRMAQRISLAPPQVVRKTRNSSANIH